MAENLIVGRTQHPRSYQNKNKSLKQRTPGGSSSGEAVLVSLGGSVLGFGSDSAGSIRIPSGLCGFAGLRHSSNRISTETNNIPAHIEKTFSGPGKFQH